MYHICFPLTSFNSGWLEKRTDEEVGVCVSASTMCPDCVNLQGWSLSIYVQVLCVCTNLLDKSAQPHYWMGQRA